MLELRNIDAGYNKRLILKDVSVKINPSAITVIMGPNGAGKSTLLKVMYGLLPPVSGGIYMDDIQIIPSPSALINQGVFLIPQGKRVFRNMTVLENLELSTHFWKERYLFGTRLEEALEHFPALKDRLHDLAGSLSGGQQQMIALARVLLNRPRMVLLDEPSIGLSPKLITETFEQIKKLKDTLGTAFVIVEHNLKTLLPLTDNAYILKQGKIAYGGSPNSKTLEKLTASIFKTPEIADEKVSAPD